MNLLKLIASANLNKHNLEFITSHREKVDYGFFSRFSIIEASKFHCLSLDEGGHFQIGKLNASRSYIEKTKRRLFL